MTLKPVGLDPPALSPDGRYVAYSVMEPNWNGHFFTSEISVGDVQAGAKKGGGNGTLLLLLKRGEAGLFAALEAK